jgi:lipopolysaccharide biosynthesis regulator YciM
MDGNEEIFARLMADPDFRQQASDNLLSKIYKALRKCPKD